MQMRGVCVLSIAVLLLSGPAFAAGSPTSSPAGAASAKVPSAAVKQATSTAQSQSSTENPHQVICRRSPPPVGSLFGGGTICHTREQWQQMSQDAQQQLNKMQMIGGNTGG